MMINRIMKRPLLLALVFALAPPLVQANPGNGRFHPREANRQNAPQRQQQAPSFQREEPQRFQRREEGNSGEQQRQRLSPEERRQLRRDIHDAGRDIYPQRR